MTFLRTPKQYPAYQPPAPNTAAAEAERRQAEDTAIAASKLSGRRQTMVGGMKIAEDEQYAEGLASKRKRATSALMGD